MILTYYEGLDEHEIRLSGKVVDVIVWPSETPLVFSVSVVLKDETLLYDTMADIKTVREIAGFYLAAEEMRTELRV